MPIWRLHTWHYLSVTMPWQLLGVPVNGPNRAWREPTGLMPSRKLKWLAPRLTSRQAFALSRRYSFLTRQDPASLAQGRGATWRRFLAERRIGTRHAAARGCPCHLQGSRSALGRLPVPKNCFRLLCTQGPPNRITVKHPLYLGLRIAFPSNPTPRVRDQKHFPKIRPSPCASYWHLCPRDFTRPPTVTFRRGLRFLLQLCCPKSRQTIVSAPGCAHPFHHRTASFLLWKESGWRNERDKCFSPKVDGIGIRRGRYYATSADASGEDLTHIPMGWLGGEGEMNRHPQDARSTAGQVASKQPGASAGGCQGGIHVAKRRFEVATREYPNSPQTAIVPKQEVLPAPPPMTERRIIDHAVAAPQAGGIFGLSRG